MAMTTATASPTATRRRPAPTRSAPPRRPRRATAATTTATARPTKASPTPTATASPTAPMAWTIGSPNRRLSLRPRLRSGRGRTWRHPGGHPARPRSPANAPARPRTRKRLTPRAAHVYLRPLIARERGSRSTTREDRDDLGRAATRPPGRPSGHRPRDRARRNRRTRPRRPRGGGHQSRAPRGHPIATARALPRGARERPRRLAPLGGARPRQAQHRHRHPNGGRSRRASPPPAGRRHLRRVVRPGHARSDRARLRRRPRPQPRARLRLRHPVRADGPRCLEPGERPDTAGGRRARLAPGRPRPAAAADRLSSGRAPRRPPGRRRRCHRPQRARGIRPGPAPRRLDAGGDGVDADERYRLPEEHRRRHARLRRRARPAASPDSARRRPAGPLGVRRRLRHVLAWGRQGWRTLVPQGDPLARAGRRSGAAPGQRRLDDVARRRDGGPAGQRDGRRGARRHRRLHPLQDEAGAHGVGAARRPPARAHPHARRPHRRPATRRPRLLDDRRGHAPSRHLRPVVADAGAARRARPQARCEPAVARGRADAGSAQGDIASARPPVRWPQGRRLRVGGRRADYHESARRSRRDGRARRIDDTAGCPPRSAAIQGQRAGAR